MKTDNSYLDKSRLDGDLEADRLIKDLFNRNAQSEIYTCLKLSESEISELIHNSPVNSFLLSVRKKPAWYNEKKLIAGQQVFKLYAAEIMMLLGVMALPYCYAASPGNKALYLSDKMRQSPGKRLFDTAQFIISVSTPGSLAFGKYGHIHLNKTRLIHALARYYVNKGGWNLEWGVPINQEDMAGTNLAFSLVILLGLQQSGIVLSDRQKEDFIFLWRYIGYQLAIDKELLPANFKEAFHLAHIIKKRNFKKSDEAVELTRELLGYYHSVAPENQKDFVHAQVRYFVGSEVADYLGLKPAYVKDKVTTLISSFNILQNLFSVHTNSYNTMMDNHQLLKLTINKKSGYAGK